MAMADDQQQFCLRWNDFQSNMVNSFKHLRDEKSFTDVTLACEGQTCKAHKMVLSACSPYFKSLLEENPSKHPIIILKDVPFAHLQAILEFMYAGEVNVAQDQLPAFLKTAERLKVKGLAEVPPVILGVTFSNGLPGAEPNSLLKWRWERFVLFLFFFIFFSVILGTSFSVVIWSTSM
uniref:BTB domain-containing protein n=1 Tax=Daphnia galeata TaxID=27404 RepID=A0A8J2WLT1_9CRUS|nr:unnamed protein product [Daphnia galeata]